MSRPVPASHLSSQWNLTLPLFSLLLIMLGAIGAAAVMLVQQAQQQWALPLLLLLVFALLAIAGWALFALRGTLGLAWRELLREWLPASGMQPDGRPLFEYYPADACHDPETGVFECQLCLPVKPL